MTLPTSVARTPSPLGRLIREWRDLRGRSQLDLALDMGVSQRHLSFIESGRSSPSRALLLALAEALGMPLRERNAVLLAAGFAPVFADTAWDAAEMRAVNRALERMLRQHEPFPALVMDRQWNVLMTNDCAPRFFGSFIDLDLHPKPRNLLRLMLAPGGMRPFVDRWPEVARGLFARLHREAPGGVLDAQTQALIAELQALPDVRLDWRMDPGASAPRDDSPVIPIGFMKDGQLRSYFSMVSTVGTPQAIAAQELRVECMFPADDATEAWHLATFGG